MLRIGIFKPVRPSVRMGYVAAIWFPELIFSVEAVTSGSNRAPAPAVAVTRKKSRLFTLFAFIVK
jgi:hypothetical protein